MPFRVDEEITASEVLLIGAEGAKIGVCSRRQALERARGEGLRLVEVQPAASPPVCRLMSAEAVSERGAGAPVRPPVLETRTIRFPLGLSETDFQLKIRHGLAFLRQGGAVRVHIPFHTGGRRPGERHSAAVLLEQIEEALSTAGKKTDPFRGEEDGLVAVISPRPVRG